MTYENNGFAPSRPATLDEMTEDEFEQLINVVAYTLDVEADWVEGEFAKNMDKVAYLCPTNSGFELRFGDLDTWQKNLMDALQKLVDENDEEFP